MRFRCQFCTGLSITHLVDLTKTEFESKVFPSSAYYRHHESFEDLEQSASDGCELCQLIVDAFKAVPWDETMWVGTRQERGSTSIDLSMYARVKGLQASDVKISIDSSELWASQGLDEVRIWDTLLVLVGPNYDRRDMDEDDEDVKWAAKNWVPLLPLTLTVPRGNVSKVHGIQVGRFQLERPLSSPANFTIARVQVALPHQDLPANFKDAISITTELGIQYLWIDSLCILQDSAHDWEVESAKMGRVYGDSTLTISAVAARSSKAGILVPSTEASRATDSPVLLPVHPSRAQDPQNRTSQMQVQVEHRDLEEEDLYSLHTQGTLNKRGWCLQESILSPRVLFYGARQIYWKCPNGYASADGLCRHARGPPDLYQEVSRQLHSNRLLVSSSPPSSHNKLNIHPPPRSRSTTLSPQDKIRLLRDYYALVKEYTSRSLTFGSDKFPAFSGLAARLSSSLGPYAAGIWTSDWRAGLLWYAEGRYALHASPSSADSLYRAPSWSWAVIDAPLLFDSTTDDQPERIPHPLEAQLLELEIVPWRKEDPFGRLETGYLVIKGRTVPLVRSRQMAKLSFDWQADFDEPDSLSHLAKKGKDSRGDVSGLCTLIPMKGIGPDAGKETGPFTVLAVPYTNDLDAVGYHDFEVDYDAFEEDEYRLLLIHADDVSVAETENRNPKARCLVIRSLENESGTESAYERAGLAFLDLGSSKLEEWETRVVTLF